MHAHDLHSGDDLSGLERRLADWRPADAGLDADRMLFAAGRAVASSSRRRFVWPAVAVGLAAVAVALGGWGAAERAERRSLAAQLRRQTEPPAALPAPAGAPAPTQPSSAEEPPEGYLTVRNRVIDQGIDAWPEPRPVRPDPPGSPPVPSGPILQVGWRDGLMGS